MIRSTRQLIYQQAIIIINYQYDAVRRGKFMFIKKSRIRPFLEYLAWKYDDNLYVPSGVRFDRFTKKTVIDLDKKTLFSAKKLLLPSREVLFEFDSRNKAKPPKFETGYTVLFGARTCDMNAIKYMDLVFGDDPYYMSRRKNMVIIGIQCSSTKRFKNCYCSHTGTFFSDVYDLLLIETNGKSGNKPSSHSNGFLVKSGSIRGEGLLATKFFSKLKKGEADAALERLRKAFESKKGKLKAERPVSEAVIKQLSKDCYSCTSCNSVCPTCHSFKIDDELNIDRKSGRRIRSWDSCQLQCYTRISGDVVFRPEREQRVRQRILCKFQYSQEDQGMMACTGCGRCIDVCNKGIDIFKVFD